MKIVEIAKIIAVFFSATALSRPVSEKINQLGAIQNNSTEPASKTENLNLQKVVSDITYNMPTPSTDPKLDWGIKQFVDRIVGAASKIGRTQGELIAVNYTRSGQINNTLSQIKQFGSEMANIDLKRIFNIERIQPIASSQSSAIKYLVSSAPTSEQILVVTESYDKRIPPAIQVPYPNSYPTSYP
ncbi:hypothetical protein AYI68_g1502 [Smittium mucronatum]|uniref:Uncharacterized protein n=1 Tax=Smittium mucronatum TaxID=133383 RepID=A0A1R0H5D4_9FUNG|nr:hypothetical protein AYI68_g1502 [Smittium mucronatum]